MKLFVPPSQQPQQSLYPLPVPTSAASFTSPEGEARVSLIFSGSELYDALQMRL